MDNKIRETLWNLFKAQGPKALSLNHYDLYNITEYGSPTLWKEFLLDPETSEWIQEEMQLIQETELKKMIIGAGTSRSVGQAQLMNTLHKLKDNTASKEGPAFIYTYIPLSSEQTQAENIITLPSDPFIKI